MHVARLRFRNVGPYKGEHVLDLEPKAYAIVAKYDDNPARSNYGGKTTIVDLIGFALFGRHGYRNEDAMISRGEAACEVELTTSDGAVILRSRQRGRSTRLYFRAPGVPPTAAAVQDGAQDAIAAHVGLGENDYLASCAVEQGEAGRLVRATSAEATKVVGAWLALDKLVECAREVGTRVSVAAREGEKLAEHRRVLVHQLTNLIGDWERIEGGLDGKIACLQFDEVRTAGKARAARDELADAASNVQLVELAAQFASLRSEGIKLAADRPARVDSSRLPALAAAASSAAGDCTRADDRVRQARSVAVGEFDGKCPVAGLECPARTLINEDRVSARGRLGKALEARSAAAVAYSAVAADLHAHEAAVRLEKATDERLEDLRRRMEVIRERVGGRKPPTEAPSLFALNEACRATQEVYQVVFAELGKYRLLDNNIARLREEIAKVAATQEENEAKLSILRAAAAVFGRYGAQRRVAESALRMIEEGANDALGFAGIDLRVTMRWSRDGNGLATACDVCGASFPSSTKVKACGCGAERGPKRIDQLDVEVSDVSGAARDLGGLALQLAATTYLRSARGSAWETVVLDEAFAQLDAANRKSLAKHLAAMLSRAGCRQALVVAHSSDASDAMPGRIEVARGADGWSRVVSVT